MPVKVKCSNCEKLLSVPDAARGKAIKCPQCQNRIAIPAEETESKPRAKTSTSKSKPKKETKPADSETALATFDMRRAEDSAARICSKCGYDMQYQEEEDTECPQCGYDSEAGGMGAKARKKAMKGPDPADFYPGLFKEAWKFVGRNYLLAWRTVMYTLVCLTISMGCAFLYLWISAWPPRWFLALCFTISFLVIPGWMWFLDTEVIKLTLERKDKFKKLNFDFFLASAMGTAFAFWCVAIALPLVCLPAALGYVLVNYGGMPEMTLPILAGLGLIPAIWMLPVSMSHMAMPVQYKGWLVWKVVPMWARNIKPLTVWLLFFLVTNIPNIGGLTAIAAIYGQDLAKMVRSMEFNADISRQRAAAIDNPSARKKGQGAPPPLVLPDPQDVNFFPLIVPGVILVVMSLANGFTCMFNMRTNGQFTYYHKSSLDMVDRLKDYKYKAKEKVDEDEDEKPKTLVQLMIDAGTFIMVFDLLGVVGGMLYGALTEAGPMKGIFLGLCIGQALAILAAAFLNIKLAFQTELKWGAISLLYPIGFGAFVFQNWNERKGAFIQMLAAIVPGLALGIFGLTAGLFFEPDSAAAPNPAPAAVQPGGNPPLPGGNPPQMNPNAAPAPSGPPQP